MAAAAPFVQLRRVLTFIPSALDDKAGLALRDVQWLAVELQDIKAALTEPKYRPARDALIKLLRWFRNPITKPFDASRAAEVLSSLALLTPLVATPSALINYPSLPNELLSLVVDAVQEEDDLHLRQQTNMALAITSRVFYRLTRPRIKYELHLTRPHYLETVAAILKKDKKRFRKIKTLSFDFDLGDLMPSADSTGPWYGQHWPFICDKLGYQTEVLYLRLRYQTLGTKWDHYHFAHAAGISEIDQWDPRPDFNNIKTVYEAFENDNHMGEEGILCTYQYCPAIFLEHKGRREPYAYDGDDFEAREIPLQVLVVPHFLLAPQQFEKFLPSPVILRRLDFTLRISGWSTLQFDDEETYDITKLFETLAPSLVDLRLRIHFDSEIDEVQMHVPMETERITQSIATHLVSLTNLETLHVGGRCIDQSLPRLLAPLKVKHLVFLPTWSLEPAEDPDDDDRTTYHQPHVVLFDSGPSQTKAFDVNDFTALRSLTIYRHPKYGRQSPKDFQRNCNERGIQLRYRAFGDGAELMA